jgi:hypothetical protein
MGGARGRSAGEGRVSPARRERTIAARRDTLRLIGAEFGAALLFGAAEAVLLLRGMDGEGVAASGKRDSNAAKLSGSEVCRVLVTAGKASSLAVVEQGQGQGASWFPGAVPPVLGKDLNAALRLLGACAAHQRTDGNEAEDPVGAALGGEGTPGGGFNSTPAVYRPGASRGFLEAVVAWGAEDVGGGSGASSPVQLARVSGLVERLGHGGALRGGRVWEDLAQRVARGKQGEGETVGGKRGRG